MIIFKIFSENERQVKKLSKQANKILALESNYDKLNDEDLSKEFDKIAKQIEEGKQLKDVLNNCYAIIREVAYRKLGLKAYKVQIMGAIALFNGDIAEMKTGEGKTLTSIFPICLHALTHEGVHVITANEYLAERDYNLNKPVFDFLKISAAVNKKDLSHEQKQAAYACDVTYTTHSEVAFDYLRDNMVLKKGTTVLREKLNYALIDEIDAILIDEARTPLIISHQVSHELGVYEKPQKFVESLVENEDYEIDIKDYAIFLTDKGNTKAEDFFNVPNLYTTDNRILLHRILQALRATYLMEKDVDYMVKDNSILIIDKFTGRVMPGKMYMKGLHQALEVKEHLKPSQESEIKASITYQNFFRLYHRICGMTGTAKTEEEEFLRTYNMRVIEIPTNKPVARIDSIDEIYQDDFHRDKALVNEIVEKHKTGQPVLIGTVSVEASENISKMLSDLQIPHSVLNAKNHEKEAEIISHAGEKNAVTVSTNMAGRGTDIKLGEGVAELGGLCVLGEERHESRRIDNQLRGRSGRQGDPGYSKFFISLDGELMTRFGGDRVKSLPISSLDPSKPLKFKILAKSIETAQKTVEGDNLAARKNTLVYDDVNHTQRSIYYADRKEVLNCQTMDDIYHILNTFNINEKQLNSLKEMVKNIPENISVPTFIKTLLITSDNLWIEHITQMDLLRGTVHLQSMAKKSPFVIYEEQGKGLFDYFIERVATDSIPAVLKSAETLKNSLQNATKEELEETAKKLANTSEKVETVVL
ncbi:preprotein translocase subunit SecA [Coprobacillus sp. OF03-2AA]|nr:preprotein translocase subunit SecA [Coprobacillus sp. OF03-2AA]